MATHSNRDNNRATEGKNGSETAAAGTSASRTWKIKAALVLGIGMPLGLVAGVDAAAADPAGAPNNTGTGQTAASNQASDNGGSNHNSDNDSDRNRNRNNNARPDRAPAVQAPAAPAAPEEVADPLQDNDDNDNDDGFNVVANPPTTPPNFVERTAVNPPSSRFDFFGDDPAEPPNFVERTSINPEPEDPFDFFGPSDSDRRTVPQTPLPSPPPQDTATPLLGKPPTAPDLTQIRKDLEAQGLTVGPITKNGLGESQFVAFDANGRPVKTVTSKLDRHTDEGKITTFDLNTGKTTNEIVTPATRTVPEGGPMDPVYNGLDVISLYPPARVPATGLKVGLQAAEGRHTEAAQSAFGLLPGAKRMSQVEKLKEQATKTNKSESDRNAEEAELQTALQAI